MPRKATPISEREHGVRATYIAGCRCDDCTAAIQNYRRQYRTRRKQEANRARRQAVAS